MTYYGIYKITNLLNGKMYIGQHTTTNIDDGYMGSGLLIERAVKKYGKENFRKEWLMFCEDEEELNYMERVYVDQTWVDRSDTYNLAIGGDCRPLTEQTRQKLSIANKGKKMSDEIKAKISNSLKGRPTWMKGKHHSETTKLKLSISGKNSTNRGRFRKGHNQWNKNKVHCYSLSEQTKQKISLHNKGRVSGMKCKHWFNNGTINVVSVDCPNGFVKGRINFNKKED